MEIVICPKCSDQEALVKSGIVNNKQRYLCKKCAYHFTVRKVGKKIDNYYIVKAIQLYLEGLSLREIERVLGVSHSTISNWIKKYNIQKPSLNVYDPAYKILTFEEMQVFLSDRNVYTDKGVIITELGSKFLVIRWNKASGS
ncbi:MAG: helix-turn-helix domain-containing protein [Xanthomarina sp.]